MNNTEVISAAAAKTGESVETCQIIAKAFEKASEQALVNKFKGSRNTQEEIVEMTSGGCQIAYDTCSRVVAALQEVMDEGLDGKLRFRRR